jgi:GH15 family glucan-1,4-alpha-glucosidase/ferredoxin
MMHHQKLNLTMYCNDAVDFHRPIFVRRIKIRNLANEHRTVRIFHQQNLSMGGFSFGDSAFYDPELRGVMHYHGKRYLLAGFFLNGSQHVDQYAIAQRNKEGQDVTWHDAEDGVLSGSPVAQGSIASTIGATVDMEPLGQATVYLFFIIGESRDEIIEQHRNLHRVGPEGIVDRNSGYWRLWVSGPNINYGNLPAQVINLFRRSLLILRTQIDNTGAIIAGTDSDILQFARDTYCYMWPRDAAFTANALDLAGFSDMAKWFYTLSDKLLNKQGFFWHKYAPDGSPASTWHPWISEGQEQLPIQEDETALVLWALWRHYFRYRDIEFVRPLWVSLVRKAAEFLVEYRDPDTGLPLPSWDLWEERYGIHAFTVSAVYGGLRAAKNFAIAFGDKKRAERYLQASEEIRVAFVKHMYSEKLRRFVRCIIPRKDGTFDVDETLDSACFAIPKFHILEADDERVQRTMDQIYRKLWVKTKIGGVARYQNDWYQRVINDDPAVPGNPWFVCTIWLADYTIAKAQNVAHLQEALPLLEWVATHATSSGLLAEQIHPLTGKPISVSPLTWSHATFVATVVKYLEKLEELHKCEKCGQSIYRLRQRGPTYIKRQAWIGKYDADWIDEDIVRRCEPRAEFKKEGKKLSIAVDTRNCIGCRLCVTTCPEGIFRLVEGKAEIDLDRVEKCTLCHACLNICPVHAIVIQSE